MATLPLGTLVTNLRFEVGHSSNPATGTNQRDQLVYYINRAQEDLAEDYTWPILRVDRDIPIAVGARYYSYPVDMPFENIEIGWLVWNTLYGKLEYGIGPEQFALWNSNLGFQSWPIERWMHNQDSGLFEVWPIPSEAPPASPTSEAALIRFRGTKLIPWMVADGDVCVLPATLITLHAAVEILSREKGEDAAMKLKKATDKLRRYRLRQTSNKTEPFVIGGGSPDGSNNNGRIGLDYIPVGYGSGPGR